MPWLGDLLLFPLVFLSKLLCSMSTFCDIKNSSSWCLRAARPEDRERERLVEMVDTEEEDASEAAERERLRAVRSSSWSILVLRLRPRSAANWASCSFATPCLHSVRSTKRSMTKGNILAKKVVWNITGQLGGQFWVK